ncbi:MAG: metal-dependent hydrolase [Haloarculaceae archaeon]
MWPWGHLAAGYLVYSAYVRLRTGDGPASLPTLVAVFATQLPDLVDKPLAWSLAVLPSGRSLAHSLVTVTPLLAVAWVLAAQRDARPLGSALAIGVLSHLGTDALYPLVGLDVAFLTFLGWPLLPVPPYEVDSSFAAHVALIEVTPAFVFEILLVVLASVAWHYDGRPGLATVRAVSGQVLASVRTE